MTSAAKARREAKHAAQQAGKYACRLAAEKKRYTACSCGDPQCCNRYDLLEDTTLLDGAVLTTMVGEPHRDSLAVPVGGKRRGGCVLVLSDEVESVVSRMKATPGFPDVRVYKDVFVEWGEPFPVTPAGAREVNSTELGRYYGYSEDAIRLWNGSCNCNKCVAARAKTDDTRMATMARA